MYLDQNRQIGSLSNFYGKKLQKLTNVPIQDE